MQKRSSPSVRIFYPRFDREELIQQLRGKTKELARVLPLRLAVLFGSYAHGNFTAASDVDLLIVYRGRQRKGAFAAVKKVIDIPRLEPHVYCEEEYRALKESTIHRMIAGGVVLFPHEKTPIEEG